MRPRIVCRMISSVDGRQFVDRWTRAAEGIESGLLRRNSDDACSRLNTDGWIVGRASFAPMADKEHAPALMPTPSSRPDHVADRRGRPLAVPLAPQGKLRHEVGEIDGDHVVADANGHDVTGVLEAIGQGFCVEALTLRGGGTVNGAFLPAGLIDEISLLVHPAHRRTARDPGHLGVEGRPGRPPSRGTSPAAPVDSDLR